MNSAYLNIAIVIVASITTILSFFHERDISKKTPLKIKISIALTFVLILLSIISNLISESDTNSRFKENMDSLSIIIRKADFSVKKMDSTLVTQKILQDSTKKLDSIARIQLSQQQKIIATTLNILESSTNAAKKTASILDRTSSLLVQNEKLLKEQKYTLENTERLVNPFKPASVHLSLLVSFDNPVLKKFIDSLYFLKNEIEKGITNHPLIKNFSASKNQVETMSINNPSLTLANSFNYIMGKYFHLSFRKNPSYENDGSDIFLTIDLNTQSLAENPFAFDVYIDFRIKTMAISYTFTSILTEFSKNDLLSLKDLNNSFALLLPENNSINYDVRSLAIHPSETNNRIRSSGLVFDEVPFQKTNQQHYKKLFYIK